jgi:hypothetical protein
MSTTLTNMGLISWTSGSDLFSSSDLSGNWSKVDVHDHTTGKGVQIPTGGIANGAVTGPKIAASAIDATKILDASLTQAKLASPSNSVYRVLMIAGGQNAIPPAANYVLSYSSALTSGASFTGGQAVPVLRWDTTDYAVAGMTTNLRVKVSVGVNSIASTQTFTFGLYPVTMGGASGNVSYTLGTVVAGSTAAVASPAASASATASSGDFALATNGYYVLGVAITGAPPAGVAYNLAARLALHHT